MKRENLFKNLRKIGNSITSVTFLFFLTLFSQKLEAAVPVVETWTFNDANNIDHVTLTKPTGVQSGDLLLIIVGSDAPNLDEWDTLTGWTKFVGANHSDADANLACYWRIADGTEADTIDVTAGTNTDERLGWYIRVSGVDTTNPINVTGTAQSDIGGTNHVINSINTTVDDCLAFYVLIFDGGDGTPFSVSAGWTEKDDKYGVANTAGYVSGCWGIKELPSQGATGDATVTSSENDGSSRVQFAIAPGAANNPPDAPSSLSQEAGGSPLSFGTWTNDNTPTLKFTQSDSDSTQCKYHIQVSSFSDFSSLAINYTSALISTGSASYTCAVLPDDDGYYWRVWSEDDTGLTSSTTTANGGAVAFKIDTKVPENVGLSTPANNAVDVATTTTLTALTATDAGSGSVQYYFELDTSYTFPSPTNSGWQSGTSWSPSLSGGTTYYWRVKAKDAAENESALCGHTADTVGYGKFITAISTGNLLPDTVDDRWHYGFESDALGVDNLCWEETDRGDTNNASIDGNETYFRGTRFLTARYK